MADDLRPNDSLTARLAQVVRPENLFTNLVKTGSSIPPTSTRPAVAEMRKELIKLFAPMGAASNQIGKT